MEDLKITVPKNIDTQQKIAAALSALDAKIELNQRINAELESMAKTLYDYWFVQFDFPNEKGKPYKSAGGKMVWSEELKREIPLGWEAGTASDLFTFNPTMSLPRDSIASYLDMGALSTTNFMTEKPEKKQFAGGMKFQNGDIVVARITPCLENGKTGMITLLEDNEIGFGSTEFIVLRGKNRPLSGFGACLSRSDLFRKFAITNMMGTSGRKRVEAKALETFSMVIPPDYLLSKFEEIVTPFFKIATTNTKESQTLTELRDWLLPMLMNGQVEVS
jgi:type I restriction enzyme S subunit